MTLDSDSSLLFLFVPTTDWSIHAHKTDRLKTSSPVQGEERCTTPLSRSPPPVLVRLLLLGYVSHNEGTVLLGSLTYDLTRSYREGEAHGGEASKCLACMSDVQSNQKQWPRRKNRARRARAGERSSEERSTPYTGAHSARPKGENRETGGRRLPHLDKVGGLNTQSLTRLGYRCTHHTHRQERRPRARGV